jgi:hypothetical protein
VKDVGTKKLEKMIHAGIKTARQLVDYPGVPECWAKSNDTMKQFNKMRKVAANLFLDRQRIVDSLENEVADLQEQYNVVMSQVNLERSVREQMQDHGEILPDQPTLPPLFSKMFDAKGYNAKILSAGRIEAILMTDFLNRKQVQLSKMMGLTSEILKLDFSYKLAQKIHVYSGIGKFFQPYKCLATVQNENNQTVYFKGCQGKESIGEISQGLKALRDRNPSAVKLIYVDNCCSVRKGLQ